MWNTVDSIVKIRPAQSAAGGINTFTALAIGAGIGIAAWAAIRQFSRTQ